MRIYIEELPRAELVDAILRIVSSICTTDEELDQLTHEMLTFMQVNKIITGKAKLEDFAEPHRTELKKIIEQKKSKIEQVSRVSTKNIKIIS